MKTPAVSSPALCDTMPTIATHRRLSGPKFGPTNFRTLQIIRESALSELSPACLGRRGSLVRIQSPRPNLLQILVNSTKSKASCREPCSGSLATPPDAAFRTGVGPKVGPPKSLLTAANDGAYWRQAVRSGHTWRLAALRGQSSRTPNHKEGPYVGLRSSLARRCPRPRPRSRAEPRQSRRFIGSAGACVARSARRVHEGSQPASRPRARAGQSPRPRGQTAWFRIAHARDCRRLPCRPRRRSTRRSRQGTRPARR